MKDNNADKRGKMAEQRAARDAQATEAKIEWHPAPSDLNDLVHTFYTLEVEPAGVDEPVPAYSAQLVIAIEGRFDLHYASGRVNQSSQVYLEAPRLEASRLVAIGPVKAIGASLTPLGWAALTAAPANEVNNCHIAADTFVRPELLDQIKRWTEEAAAGECAPSTGMAFLEAILRNAPHRVKPRHRAFVKAMNEWLSSEFSPPVEAFYERVALSPRQSQRLSKQFFGGSPSQVLMRHRAIRAAMLLANPDLPQSLRDELDVAYFDQAHMIRDIRRFTGRTPAGISEQSLSNESLDPAGHGSTAALMRKSSTGSTAKNDSQ